MVPLRNMMVLSAALFAASAFAQPQSPDGMARVIDLLQSYTCTPNITYSVASGYECKLDIYVRKNSPAPVPTVMYIHGGGWVAGTKEAAVLNILPYLEMGFSVVNVEYRLAKVALAPAAVEDCRLALRWVFKNARIYNFDTTRTVVTGGSAGGHLALMTGMVDPTAGFDAPKEWETASPNIRVAAIINWFGITDVKDLLAGQNRQMYAVSWIGSQHDPEKMAEKVSPLTYIKKKLPPVLTIHGDKDDLVPHSHAVRLHEALANQDVPSQLVTVSGGKHGGFPRDEMIRIYGAIHEFLQEHGILTK